MPSVFDKQVYDIVMMIEPGSVMTYAEVAQAMGAKGIRSCAQAVGQALRRNPYPIDKPRSDGFFVPCHRVIASGNQPLASGNHPTGRIGGFVGASRGAAICRKRRLLAAEGVRV
jgi:O-6-methylguanine DNA methyltransferase